MKILNRLWIICILFIALVSLNSCGESHFAEKELELETECWSHIDTLSLSFDNTDTSKIYQIHFPVVLTEEYAYRNIYLRAKVISPSGDENVLPARFDLAAPTGEWFSEPSGDEIPFKLGVEDGLLFNQTGQYTIKMYHFMRDEPLCGVRSAGIVLDEVGQ